MILQKHAKITLHLIFGGDLANTSNGGSQYVYSHVEEENELNLKLVELLIICH